MAEAAIRVFYSYSRKDQALQEKLDQHLAHLKYAGLIVPWYDLLLEPGSDWQQGIGDQLDTADIILLLVSANFLSSEYCYSIELRRALERDARQEACVIPVILEPCDWKHDWIPFSKLTALPNHEKAITEWENREKAFASVAQSIRGKVLSLIQQRRTEEQERQRQLQLNQEAAKKRQQEVEKQLQEEEQARRRLLAQKQAEERAERERQIQLEQKRQEVEKLQQANEQAKRVLLPSEAGEQVEERIQPKQQQIFPTKGSIASKPSPSIQRKQPNRTSDISRGKEYARGGEELEKVIKIVDGWYVRKTGSHLNDVQRDIVQGAWYKWSYEEIANNGRHNRIILESSGPRLWKILSKPLGERVNKSNFREVMKRYLSKSGISIAANDDKNAVNRGITTQICEYVSTLSGHSGWVNSVVISSDRQIISGGQDNTVKIWDLDTGKHLGELGTPRNLRDFWKILSKKHSDRIHSVAISSDSRVLASASEDRTVIVWDLATYGNLYPPLRHQGAVYCVAISPDNQFIASGCSDHTINIWDLRTGKQIKRFVERDAIKALTFSPDGQILISASEDKIIKTWTVPNWSSQNLPFDYESSPDSLALSENGKILAISCKNRKIQVIDFHSREQLYFRSGQVVTLSPDNEILATAFDKEISLWKQETGELICPPVKAGNLVRSLAFSSDGLALVSGQGEEIKTWRIRKDKLLP